LRILRRCGLLFLIIITGFSIFSMLRAAALVFGGGV
jgi:hypothetical protein